MGYFTEIFWDLGCFERGNWPMAEDFLEKVAEVITNGGIGITAEVMRRRFGPFISLRRDKDSAGIYVVGDDDMFMLTYDGTDAISGDFADKIKDFLLHEVSVTYKKYCSLCSSPVISRSDIGSLIESM